eukprot:CAMPEP_0197073686 /NCGR_PEP_ID=MMETSP1384-20130603/210731_1 /TAXON_ID=29189 /ORGANISM="Ammonia sp." /LENGTH=489 /DNA_ID=CAMNT_0042512525 /DNA_START=80 /DNA_END=1549 /DNA_ORIENTATION=+
MASQMFRIKRIKEALKDGNIEQLKKLAKKHGFINDKLRKQAWPMVLGIKLNRKRAKSEAATATATAPQPPPPQQTSSSPPLHIHTRQSHRSRNRGRAKQRSLSLVSNNSCNSNYHQIEKDIDRSSLNYYSSDSKDKHNLGRILHSMFDESDDMHYIQGFNDVVSVFYAVCDQPALAKKLSKKVARTLLKDYVMNGRSELNFEYCLKSIFKLIKYHDAQLDELFDSIDSVCALSFCVSWLLTWFAHEIKDKAVIARIYDYCLCSHQSISLYLSAALLIYCKQGLLSTVTDDVTLHVFFQKLQWQHLDFNKIIEIAETLHGKYPPSMILPVSSSFSSLNAISVMIDLTELNNDDEIKEQTPADTEAESSSYEYGSDFTPSTSTNCNDTPFYSTSFDMIQEAENKQAAAFPNTEPAESAESALTAKQIQENNDKYKPRVSMRFGAASGARSNKFDFLDSLEKIPDALTNTIDDFISIFDKKKNKKQAEPVAT